MSSPYKSIVCKICDRGFTSFPAYNKHQCKGGTRLNHETGLVELVKPKLPIEILADKTAAERKALDYTDAQKSEVVRFVNEYNAEHGKGGQYEAAKKFNVPPLTIAAWLKKIRASATTELGLVVPANVKVITKPDPAWDNARLYFRLVRVKGQEFIASQIMLGWELSNCKKALGFVNGNNQHGRVGELRQPSKTWEQYLHDEIDANLPRRTADDIINTFLGFCEKCPKKLRINFESGKKQPLISIFSEPPSSLTEKDRKTIETAITKASDGETQRSLLEALRLVKVHVALTGGDTSGSKKDKPSDAELMGQLAFKFVKLITKELQTFRGDKDRDAYLATLDIISSDEDAISLTTLEANLEAALNTVRAAKNAKLKQAKGKVISDQ